MFKTKVLLPDSNRNYEMIGESVKSREWDGYYPSKYTISIHVQNFKGRILLEGSMEKKPIDDIDWFSIPLTENTDYIQFPVNPKNPTGNMGGDSSVFYKSFNANVLWFRIKMIRNYLLEPHETEDEIIMLGSVKKILLS